MEIRISCDVRTSILSTIVQKRQLTGVSGALCSAWGIVMFTFLPDSPVTARGLSLREKRIAVDRIRENQTGVENKHLKPYQILEAFMDYKLYMFFMLGVVCKFLFSIFLVPFSKSVLTFPKGNIPNGGISNFGTIIIQGFGFSTLVTTLMQVSLIEGADSFSNFTINRTIVIRSLMELLSPSQFWPAFT